MQCWSLQKQYHKLHQLVDIKLTSIELAHELQGGHFVKQENYKTETERKKWNKTCQY